MTGIILAGGENRRMGVDKAFLSFAGRPIIEHILDVFKDLFLRVIIVTNSPRAYAAYDAKLVPDALDVRGPLTGIYSGLLGSDDEYNFVVACDMPFLNPGLISYMQGIAEGHDVTVPRMNGHLEPLHAVYRKQLVSVIEARLRSGTRRMQDIFEAARVRYITEPEIDCFDPGRRSFINLNTPQEYKEATCSDLECRS